MSETNKEVIVKAIDVLVVYIKGCDLFELKKKSYKTIDTNEAQSYYTITPGKQQTKCNFFLQQFAFSNI